MDILLVTRDPLVRDQIKVGLQQFPEFTVTVGEGYAGVNLLRQREFAYLFLEVDPHEREGLQLLHHLRSFDRVTPCIVVTGERAAKDMAGDKGRLNINSFLQVPIDVKQFFRMVGRLRERWIEAEGRRSSGSHARV